MFSRPQGCADMLCSLGSLTILYRNIAGSLTFTRKAPVALFFSHDQNYQCYSFTPYGGEGVYRVTPSVYDPHE